MNNNLRRKLVSLSDQLESAWEGALIPIMFAPDCGIWDSEEAQVAARYAGKHWKDVKPGHLKAGYASLVMMNPEESAYYMMSFFYHGIRLILEGEGSRDGVGTKGFDRGLSLVMTAGRACSLLAFDSERESLSSAGTRSDAERLLSAGQREAVYRALCLLSGLVPELNRPRMLWFHRVRHGKRQAEAI